MSVDVQKLLEPVSADAPCGPTLAYDPEYLALEEAAKGTPERQAGDKVLPAEDPDWSDVRDRALALAKRTKDLRIVLYLTVGETRVSGITGLRDGLTLLKETLTRYWDTLHPQLDPADNNDPTERMNIVASVAAPPDTFGDPLAVQRRVIEAPLTPTSKVGKFSFRDVKTAAGELPPLTPDAKPPDAKLIDAAFTDAPIEDLKATGAAIEESVAAVKEIDRLLTDKVGPGKAPDLTRFVTLLGSIATLLQTHLARRGVGSAPGSGAAAGGAGGGVRMGGELLGIQDVQVALDMVCRYYERYEVSSPVPLLVKGAQRLVSQSFVEIAKVLTPDTIDRLKELAGLKDEQR